MGVLLLLLCCGTVLALIVLDVLGKINLMHIVPLTLYLIAGPNFVLLMNTVSRRFFHDGRHPLEILWFLLCYLLLIYLWARFNIFPLRKQPGETLRLHIMLSGRFLIYRSLWGMALAAVCLPIFAVKLYGNNMGVEVGVENTVLCVAFLFFSMWNGILRIFFTSRRLSVVYRVLIALTVWIPLVNLVVLAVACRKVYEEYDFAVNREQERHIRAGSDLCRTKYPLVMVHGVLFRDLKYFNYWGRIPKELTRYGATVYYGNQEAVGTIARNGADLREKILEIVGETGCGKVNVIAHSKGGLDARHAITHLGMDQYVASLTTMNTPHRGCKFVDKLVKGIPGWLYRLLTQWINAAFRRMGDKEPDFYNATQQFTTAFIGGFNETTPDKQGVYYQSYMSKMTGALSYPILTIPYLLIKGVDGENDGLVTPRSAAWGEFRELYTSTTYRGVSHGDIIDLNREDYKGFDVIETYINIVSDLKSKGF